MTNAYGSIKGRNEYDPNIDVDGDDDVDIFDIVMICSSYGEEYTP